MSDNNHYGGAHLLLAFIAGGIAGAAVALLSAPQSGAESRDTLTRMARDAQGKAVRVPPNFAKNRGPSSQRGLSHVPTKPASQEATEASGGEATE